MHVISSAASEFGRARTRTFQNLSIISLKTSITMEFVQFMFQALTHVLLECSNFMFCLDEEKIMNFL